MPTYQMKPAPVDPLARAQLSDEQNVALENLEKVENDQRDANGGYRKKKKDLKERIKEIRQELRSGQYRARVDVDEVPDDARLMVAILDKKTKQQIDIRPMSQKEQDEVRKRKQGSLDFNGKAKTNGKANGAAHVNGKSNGHVDAPVKVGKRDATPAGDTAVSIKGQPLVNRKKALKAKGKKAKGARA